MKKIGEAEVKFIVDEMPESKSKCHFSEWKPYPPIVEQTGRYICKINHNDCSLCETECQFLKTEIVGEVNGQGEDYQNHR